MALSAYYGHQTKEAGPMNRLRLLTVFALFLVSALTVIAKTKEEKQADARKKANQVLARLYKATPSAEGQIKTAAGYAVFSNAGMKILVAGGGKGQGIAVDRSEERRVGKEGRCR